MDAREEAVIPPHHGNSYCLPPTFSYLEAEILWIALASVAVDVSPARRNARIRARHSERSVWSKSKSESECLHRKVSCCHSQAVKTPPLGYYSISKSKVCRLTRRIVSLGSSD